jgi:hypothetical protein
MKLSLLLLSAIFLSSCSLAPFSSTYSGRSYGAGKANIELGNVASNYYTRLGYGVSKNLDVGYTVEFGNFNTSGVLLKYSFLNQPEGLSIAAEYSFGGTDKSEFWYGGGIVSLNMAKTIELYLNARYNRVDIDPADYELGDDLGGIQFEDYDLAYLYMAFGMNVWFSQTAGLNIYMIRLQGDNVTNDGTPFGASMIFNY